MAPILYTSKGSPPVRAVLITAKSIGLELDEKEVNLFTGENHEPEYLKMNPQHTVPTLVDDDGFVIWDSHAIMVYLVSKYAENDDLYFDDLQKRALIDQRLHFNSGVLFPRMRKMTKSIFRDGMTFVEEKDIDGTNECYEFLEKFLEIQEWCAGDSVTIADYSIITTVSTLNIMVPVDPQVFPKLTKWMDRFDTLPEYEAGKGGLQLATDILQSKLVQHDPRFKSV